jgi:hypothetical protein
MPLEAALTLQPTDNLLMRLSVARYTGGGILSYPSRFSSPFGLLSEW